MAYSDYFNFGGGPELVSKTGKTNSYYTVGILGHSRKRQYNAVEDARENTEANKAFDKIMAGHDATTAQYTNTLKSIYDGYSNYADDFEGQVQPIIDALGGDIENLTGYMDNYNELLASNKDTFLNGIITDPNSSRTRSEYTTAVADEYDSARESLKRNELSQGRNPYLNTGSTRSQALDRAKALGGAEGQAYTDWRAGHNRDVQSQQNATGQYLGLQANAGRMQGDIINARAGIGSIYGNILNSRISANKEKAAGYEGLTSLAESRRQEALGLGQQQQENARQNADIKQQLTAKLTARDKRFATGTAGWTD
jgi:hypothetical protein